jgi:hypothetical protein
VRPAVDCLRFFQCSDATFFDMSRVERCQRSYDERSEHNLQHSKLREVSLGESDIWARGKIGIEVGGGGGGGIGHATAQKKVQFLFRVT